MPTVFDNSDRGGDGPYLRWLAAHPHGVVLQTRRRFDPAYAVLHRASCRTISTPTAGMHADPFTSRAYIKICADAEASLLRWLNAAGGSGFSKRCSICGA